jgi:hypothetical protein
MSDINSSLPVRTELPGDVAAKIVDATTPSQGLAVDASGRIIVKLDDGAGNIITSQVNGTQRALDVGINVAGVQIDPRQIRALTAADIVTAAQGAAGTAAQSWFTKISDGTNTASVKAASTAAVATDSALVVALSPNTPLPAGTNLLGSVNQGTSPWITKDQADGSAVGGTAGTFSMLGGGLYNTALPTLTTGQQAAFQLDSSGRLIIRPLTAADVVTSRLNDGLGNAITSSAAGGTRPIDAALRDSAGNLYTAANPFPVQMSAGEAGTEKHDYNTASAIAAGATSNHDYSVTATKTFKATKFWASASGKLKIEVQTSIDGTTFVSRWVGFNSTANPNITIDLGQFTISDTGTGAKIRIIRTNKETVVAQDVYSTISGVEV